MDGRYKADFLFSVDQRHVQIRGRMSDAIDAAKDARKHTKVARPIHKSMFLGSPRKLKGKSRGKWVDMGNGKWRLVYE
jgi:hypothetical protein